MKNNKKTKKSPSTTSNTTTITYQGNVKINVVDRNNKIIKSFNSHNDGKYPLFKFILLCLGEEYTAASDLAPKYIRLFDAKDKDNPKYEEEKTSTAIIYNTRPNIVLDKDDSSITFKFLIPFSQLKNKENINLFALYGENNKSTSDSPSATFLLLDEDGNLGSAISSSDNSKDYYTLSVEWTMRVNNS